MIPSLFSSSAPPHSMRSPISSICLHFCRYRFRSRINASYFSLMHFSAWRHFFLSIMSLSSFYFWVTNLLMNWAPPLLPATFCSCWGCFSIASNCSPTRSIMLHICALLGEGADWLGGYPLATTPGVCACGTLMIDDPLLILTYIIYWLKDCIYWLKLELLVRNELFACWFMLYYCSWPPIGWPGWFWGICCLAWGLGGGALIMLYWPYCWLYYYWEFIFETISVFNVYWLLFYQNI